MKKILTCVLFFILVISTKAYGQDEIYEVHFIDTKQSDCILIKAGDKNYIIDTGNVKMANKVVDYLNKEKISKIDSIILTHYHDDHYGGLKAILSSKEVGSVLLPDYSSKDKNYVKEIVKNKKVKLKSLNATSEITYKDMKLKVIYPKKFNKDIENNNSIILAGEIDGIKYGFLGDCEKEEEEYFLSFKDIYNCDIVKIPHHGLDTSSTKSFIKALNPQIAIVTCDGSESPSRGVIKRLERQNTIIYRTDKYGSIVFTNKVD